MQFLSLPTLVLGDLPIPLPLQKMELVPLASDTVHPL